MCQDSRSSDMVVFQAVTPCGRGLFQRYLRNVLPASSGWHLGQVVAEVIWRKGSVHYITSHQTHSQWRWRQYITPKSFKYMLWKPQKSPSLEQCSKNLKTYIKSKRVIHLHCAMYPAWNDSLAQYSYTAVFILPLITFWKTQHITFKLFCVAGSHLSKSFTVTIFCFIRNLYLHLCSEGITLILILLQ